MHSNTWQYMGIHGYTCINGNTWQCMVIHCNTWLYMAVHGNTWQLHGYTWQYMAIHGITWEYMAIHGSTWLYMAIHGTYTPAFSQLYNIRRIRKYLTTDTSKTLVHAMITSRIDYCNSLLCGPLDNSLNKLQRVQNTAARLITGPAKFSHITPVLRSLHWLPIKQRVQFKILILIFKAINGLAPNYISNLVNTLCPSKYLLRRNNEILLEPYNGKTKKTLGDRAFAVAAPRLFNSLPREIRHETCFNTF